MTDPTGRSFLSYRRSRISEASLLIQAQHEIGIPTWQDIADLAEEPTEESIRSVLNDEGTANAIMWLTPDVAQSPIIQQVEAPVIIGRVRRKDGFFIIPVAANGASYEQAAATVQDHIGIDDLRRWNLLKVSEDPITMVSAQRIAQRVMERRLSAIAASLPPDQPIELMIFTRDAAPAASRVPIILEWHHRFVGREATLSDWSEHLLPALSSLSSLCLKVVPTRRIVASGLPSIPAATALGQAFLAPRKQALAWRQHTTGRPDQIWSVDVPSEDSEYEVQVIAGDATARDLAVLVSVNADVQQAISASRDSLPKFRAYVHVKRKASPARSVIETPGQAAHLARLVIDKTREVRKDFQTKGMVHLFMAVPVGLAMMIGQLLNTLGQVQTYEHIQSGAVGVYRPAALLSQ